MQRSAFVVVGVTGIAVAGRTEAWQNALDLKRIEIPNSTGPQFAT